MSKVSEELGGSTALLKESGIKRGAFEANPKSKPHLLLVITIEDNSSTNTQARAVYRECKEGVKNL
jgi:hypothetical protein